MGDRILEVGAAGLEGADAKVKALMNNMVNAETPAYRKSDVVVKSFPTYLDQAQTRSSTQTPRIEGTIYNQASGTLLRTGNKTDLALGGEGFFVVETADGLAYTRDGRFALNQNGQLLTVAGNYPVMGLDGPIKVPAGSDLEFSPEGKIMINGAIANTLRTVKFADTNVLKSVTGSLFSANEDANPEINPTPRIVAGYVEASNVNIIEEMMNLIYLSRAYGMDAKIISNRDTMMTRALEMGRPIQ